MKSFLRENPTIAFGLGLPLLLVVIFLLVSGIPALLVDPPKYDAIFVTDAYTYQSGVQISVVDQKARVVYQGSVLNNQKPRIWRYDVQTGGVREITYLLPAGLTPPGKESISSEDASRVIPVAVPELDGLTLDTSSIAPDGYAFDVASERYSRHIFGELFYSSRYRNEAVLTKRGRSIRLPNTAGVYYRGNTRFIGWVVSP